MLPPAKVPPAAVAPSQRRYGLRLPFPGASLSAPAGCEPFPRVQPPEGSLKSQAPLGVFLPPLLLASSAPTATVGNPGEGGWVAAALRTCPRTNPGAVSRLVSGYTALRRLELQLLASRSQPALSAATETCTLGSFPYIYWLLSSPACHSDSWSLSPPLGPLAATAPAPPGGASAPAFPPPSQPVRHRSPPLCAALSPWVPQLSACRGDQFSAIAWIQAETPAVGGQGEGEGEWGGR